MGTNLEGGFLMKKFSNYLLVMIMLVSSLSASAIGYIEVERVFKNYKETDKVQKEFMKKEKNYNKVLSDKQQDLREARIEGKSEKEIEKLTKKIEKELTPQKEDLEKLFQQNMMEIRADIVKATEVVARDLGVDVVVDKQVVITGGVDLSDLVIEKLNKR